VSFEGKRKKVKGKTEEGKRKKEKGKKKSRRC